MPSTAARSGRCARRGSGAIGSRASSRRCGCRTSTLISPSRERTLEAAAAALAGVARRRCRGTATTHRVKLGRVLPRARRPSRRRDRRRPTSPRSWRSLHAAGRKRETIRKTVSALAMVLDFAGASSTNPARDRLTVRLPREERRSRSRRPRTRSRRSSGSCRAGYPLPLLVLDATGMRVGELEALTWGDVDEPRHGGASRSRREDGPGTVGGRPGAAVRGRPRARAARRPDSRTPGLPGRHARSPADGDRASVHRRRVPAFSPHDLRHRRISL